MEDGIAGYDIEQGNPNSIFDESLYNTRHERNRIFIQTYKSETLHHQNPNPNPIPDSVKVTFHLTHQIVRDDHLPCIARNDGLRPRAIDQVFTQPLGIFDSYEQARPAFEDMLSRFRIPFEFRAEFGEIHWGYGSFEENDPIQGFDGVVDRISKASLALVRQSLAEKSINIKIRVMKRTVVDAKRYRGLIRVWQAKDKVPGGKRCGEAMMMLETVSFDGTEPLECSICLKLVAVGTQVSILPCSHKFHKDCIHRWLKRKQTCALCRLPLLDAVDRSIYSKNLCISVFIVSTIVTLCVSLVLVPDLCKSIFK